MHYRNVTMHLSLIGDRSLIARETTWSTTTEAPTLVLQLFQNKLKTTLSKQHLSIHKLHHTEPKWATKFTGSAQKLPPPPPPPQAMQGPGAVPNLLPSTCRASATPGSASRSSLVGPRCTESGHLARLSPNSGILLNHLH